VPDEERKKRFERESLGENFDRHLALQRRVFRALDLTHASGTKLAGDTVMSDGLYDHEGVRLIMKSRQC